MKINRNIFICALLVLMLFLCVNACSADESLNETLGTDAVDDVVVAEAPSEELSASGDTYVVDANGGGDYQTISDAVSAATGGETIFVKNGNYTESSLSFSNSVKVVGESKGGVNIKSDGNIALLTTPYGTPGNVSFENLNFIDSARTGGQGLIYLSGTGEVNFTNCIFKDLSSKYGAIQTNNAGTVTISHCTFDNVKEKSNSPGAGLMYLNSASATNIFDCEIKNCGYEASSGQMNALIYEYSNKGTINIERTTIVGTTGAAGSLIRSAGKVYVKDSVIANNTVSKNANGAVGDSLFYVTGELDIQTSVIQNNSGPKLLLYKNTAADFTMNYCNVQGNTFDGGFTDAAAGDYDANANWWGSNDLPADVTATTWVVEDNGEYTLNTGDALAKDIPELTGGDEPGPQPAAYDVYVAPEGTGDGSSIDNPTNIYAALEIVPEGGSIFMCNGEYGCPDAIYITKPVNIVGESRDGVLLMPEWGIIIGNSENLYDESYQIMGSVSLSSLTFKTADTPFDVLASCNIEELNISDCVIEPPMNWFIGVSLNVMNEPMQTVGTLNFNNNVLSYNSEFPIAITGSWDANINNNVFLNSESGENAIGFESIGIINTEYNYWGSNSPATPLNPEKYIVINANSNASEIYTDESAKITIEAELNDGSSAASYLPDYPYEVTLDARGTLSQRVLVLNNGFAQATYTSDVARSDIVDVTVLGQSIGIPITVKERYTGIIYVDTTGSDDNEGSINAPVATVGKAIELANAGSHEIIINEGTYAGNSYNVAGDLKVTGNGKVTLDANNEGRLFYMNYGDTANKIELHNLILTNANGFGAAVYSLANELILDNVTIVNNQASNYLITSKGKLTIKDSEISNSMSGDVIQQTGNGDILINNTIFKDNSIVDSSSVMAVINLNSYSGNLVIENSKFINNTARQGVIKGNYNYNIDVKGTEFIDNTNTVSYGGAIYTSGGTLDVTDCVFINNKAARSGGAIYVGYRTTATVDKSVFVNNTANTMNDEYYGDAIYDGNKLTVSNSVLLTNSNNGLIYSDGEDNVPYAQNCWWGTNEDPSSLNGVGYYEDDDWEEYDCPPVDVSNWVTMDASFAPEDAQAGDEVTVTAVFSNANLPDGIEVTFTSTSGLNTVVSTVAGQASTTYTIAANDEAIVATSTNAVVEMPIAAALTNIVTNDTFFRFFDENGMLLDTIEFDELIFQGEFSDLVDTIIISDEITLTSDNAVLNNIALYITGDDVTVTGFTLNENDADFTNNGGAALYVSGSDVTLDNVSVTYNAPNEVEAKAIFANGAENFALVNSEIILTGANPGSNHYRGLEVRNSDAAKIDNNTISAVLPAVPVDFGASGIAQDLVLAVGIQGGDDVEFTNNRVNVNTNGAVGSYPTIDAVMIHSTNDISIKGNNITHIDTTTEDGARYYYSLDIYNTTGTVEENNIVVNTTAGVDRAGTAYPIQLTGPFTVTIKDNNLTAVSKGPIAGIYASNWPGAATLIIEDNNIDVNGYATTGNYALVAGIEAEIDVFKAYNNTITVANGADYDDANQVIGVGIGSSYFYGDTSADIKDNTITVDGKYAVYYAKAINTNVTGNTLYGHELEGDDAAIILDGTNNIIKDNLPVKPYEGIIYVDLAGSDDNIGSIDAPVATIAKAVELALAGSGQIIVNEGTYDVPQVSVAGDLDIAGNGTVVFEAQDATKKAFWITAGDVSISGVTFTNFNATYSGSVIRVDAGSLTIDDSKFIKNGGENRQALIQVKGADLTLTNTVFEENTASKTGTSYGNIYIVNNGDIVSTLEVNNCTFVNNHNKYGALYIGSTIATIYNSSFIGNNATSTSGGSGAAIYASGTATYISSYSGNLMTGLGSFVLVEGCEFINNTAFGGTYYAGQGGAIYVNNNVTMVINECLFENNSVRNTTGNDKPGQGGAIYASAGKILIQKSIFKNNDAAEGSEIYMRYYNSHLHPEEVNTLEINNSIILNDGVAIVADSTNGTYVANDNWWGTNDEPADKVVNVNVDSWATMDASFAPEDAQAGDEVTVTAVFSNPNLPDGIEVTFTSTSGLNTVVSTVDAQASTTYTIDASDKEINATSGSAVIVMPLSSTIPTVLSAEDLEMTFKDGSAWTVTLTDGTDPIEGAVVKVGILGKTYSLTTGADGTVSLPVNVAPGTYDVNATFEGDDTYESSFVNATVTVGKAVSTLTAENITMGYKNGSWIVTLTGAEGVIPKAAIKFGISGKVYTIKTDENGVAALPINLAPGTYEINATFEGNAKHESAFVDATVTVEKAVATLAAQDLTMCYKDGTAYSVTVTDAKGAAVAGTTVKFTIGTKSYNIKTDANGVAALPINLNIGEYTVTAVVDDAKYTSEEATQTVTVTDYAAVLVANDINMTYQDGTNYEVQLTTADGTPIAVANLVVKITINGKAYNIKTDAEGIAKVPINLKAGSYTISAEYNGAEITNTIVVNKA